MHFTRRTFAISSLALAGAAGPLAVTPAFADDREKLVARGHQSLQELASSEPRSRRFAYGLFGLAAAAAVVFVVRGSL